MDVLSIVFKKITQEAEWRIDHKGKQGGRTTGEEPRAAIHVRHVRGGQVSDEPEVRDRLGYGIGKPEVKEDPQSRVNSGPGP